MNIFAEYMPGALVHIGIGLLSALIVYFIMYKLEFSLAIFIGNLLPDVLKIAYLAFYYNSINIPYLMASYLHLPTTKVINSWDFIIFFLLFFFALGWLLYHYHWIKKKKFMEWDELVLYIAIGYIIHVIMDATMSRTGIWI